MDDHTIKAAIPGLAELRAARNAEARYREATERMMEDEGNDGARPPRRPTTDPDEIAKQYPRAACYLRAESYEYATNDRKSAAGRKATRLLESGGSIEDADQIMATWLAPSAVWD